MLFEDLNLLNLQKITDRKKFNFLFNSQTSFHYESHNCLTTHTRMIESVVSAINNNEFAHLE